MAQQHSSPESVQPKPHAEDEIVHTPTKHRARWIMGILLLILILTTFTVGDEIKGLLTGQGRGSAYATWDRPGHGKQSISAEEWQGCLRSLGKLFSVMGNQQLSEADLKQEVAATFVVGALAEDAGIAITDKELGGYIVSQFGNAQNYQVILPQYRVTPTEFETTLRQRLAIYRYTATLGGAWNTPDVGEIEKAWKSQHQEYAFDYVVVPVEQLQDEGSAPPIGDEELRGYFDSLPQAKREAFKTKEKLAVDFAGMTYENASTVALFTKFPVPTDEAELEKQTQAYFDGPAKRRFAGKTLDAIKERVRAEALVHGALQAWLKDMRAREERGVAVNFSADAQALGISFQHMPTALEQSEWLDHPPAPWVGHQSVARLFSNATDSVEGKFCPDVIVDETGFVIAHVYVKAAPAIPPFEQLASTLRKDLRQQKARDIATQRLELLRQQFGTPPPPVEGQPAPPFMPDAEEGKFTAVMSAAGLEVQRREFKPRTLPPTQQLDPIDIYLREQPIAFSAKPGAVLPAGCDSLGHHAFLVRVRGTRDSDLSLMKPSEFANISVNQQATERRNFQQKVFSLGALESRFNLKFNEKNPE